MKKKEMRYLVPDLLYQRYKIVCAINNLSIPNQTRELIRAFTEAQEETLRRLDKYKKQ
jgi:hypothetical protein